MIRLIATRSESCAKASREQHNHNHTSRGRFCEVSTTSPRSEPRLFESSPDVATDFAFASSAAPGLLVVPRTASTSRSNRGRSSSVSEIGSASIDLGPARGIGGDPGRTTAAGAATAGTGDGPRELAAGLVNSSMSSRCVRSSSGSLGIGTVIVAPQCGHFVSVPALRLAIPSNRLHALQRNRMGIPNTPNDKRSKLNRVTLQYNLRHSRLSIPADA